MNLAFYAPLKPPNHPTPSGDRTMARALISALTKAQIKVDLASDLRSRDGVGDAATQDTIQQHANAECARLIEIGKDARWRAWISYHNYYKAPDLLGPAVAQALGIPYLQIESTRARKRLGGPWDSFARAAEAASDAADVIFYLTKRDAWALERDAPKGQHLIHLHPFLNRDTLPDATSGTGPMLSVGMMREGDKLGSYQLIAQTLALLPKDSWQLQIAGDGPARAKVAALMAPYGPAVTFLGEQSPEELAQHYRNSSLLFWPGVNEAFGLAYLEAQAHALPVIAQDRPGVCDVLAPGDYPAVSDGAQGMAAMIEHYQKDPALRTAAGRAAQAYVADHHLLSAAAQTLRAGLGQVGVAL